MIAQGREHSQYEVDDGTIWPERGREGAGSALLVEVKLTIRLLWQCPYRHAVN